MGDEGLEPFKESSVNIQKANGSNAESGAVGPVPIFGLNLGLGPEWAALSAATQAAASEISPGKKLKTRFLILTKTKEPAIEDHTRNVHPAAVRRNLVGVKQVWRVSRGALSRVVQNAVHEACKMLCSRRPHRTAPSRMKRQNPRPPLGLPRVLRRLRQLPKLA